MILKEKIAQGSGIITNEWEKIAKKSLEVVICKKLTSLVLNIIIN